ncbi:MAG: hypothetical protein QF464_02465 [Myxococcota bacterium]|nr:hypothetical protein [Myxococcota bacterium]
MTTALLALFATCTVASSPCDGPAACRDSGVCVAGQCRIGSERAVVEILSTVAVPSPVMLAPGADLEARAANLARRAEHALDWTSFYAVIPREQHPRVPSITPMTTPAQAMWRTFGVHRVMRLRVGRGLDPGSILVEVDVVDTARGEVIAIGAGPEQILAGGDRRAVARWINALVGHDTGIPGCVGTRLLASVEIRRGNKEIAVLEADGPGLSFVTSNGSLNLGPAWGPNGAVGYMSYLRRNPDWVVNGAPFSTRPGLNAAGAWSPDGRLLALTVTEDGNSDIVLLDTASGGVRSRITTDPGVDTSAAWSPDGRKIAFVSDRTGGPQIWIHDVEAGSARRLSEVGYMGSPVWSPLGDTVVYTQLVAGQAILLRHDLDTGRIQRLTEPGMSAEAPTISPDGRYVAFVRRSDGNPPSLWRIPIRGGDLRPLAQHAWPLYAPDWQP